MNNTFEMIPYNPSSSLIKGEDSLLATGLIAFASLAVAAMQHCTTNENAKPTEPLRISIPPHVESPPATPSPPPRPTSPPPAPSRPKKAISHYDDELDVKIIRFLRFNPGSTVKDMLKIFKAKDPSLTKSDLNSRLYSMLKMKTLQKEGDVGVPNWFIN